MGSFLQGLIFKKERDKGGRDLIGPYGLISHYFLNQGRSKMGISV